MNYGLDDNTIQRIQQVFRLFPQVEQVILYGSRAKGNFRPGSDIDLTVKGENLSLSVMNEISLLIDDLLLPYMFDISVYSHIRDKDLLDHIERVGRVFYDRDHNETG